MHFTGRPFQVETLACFTLLLLHTLLLFISAARHSPVTAELMHVAAGVSHLSLGNFDVYRVHPPLVRLLAAMPLQLATVECDWSRVSPDLADRCELPVGCDFVRANGPNAWWLFLLSRCVVIPFSVLGALIVRRWSRDLYGRRSGLMALTIWCFCPTILGHGAFVTADVAVASLGIGACYLFRIWATHPTWQNAMVFGCVLGLAQLAKTTLILLYPVTLCLLLYLLIVQYRDLIGRLVCQYCWAVVLSLAVINAGYGFEKSGTPVGHFSFVSSRFKSTTAFVEHRIGHGLWSRIPVPLPKNLVLGMDLQQHDFEVTKRSYLAGQWRNGGWYYFYLYASLLKEPLGFLILTSLVAVRGLRSGRFASAEPILLFAPSIALFVFVSAHSGFSIHYRYVLPALPGLIVWTSQIGAIATIQPRLVRLCMAWGVCSSVATYPHSLSYFNELAGGPRNGSRHLVGSAISWGQDLWYLQKWLNQVNPRAPLYLATLAYPSPQVAGIQFQSPQPIPNRASQQEVATSPPGLYVVDVNFLRDTWEPAAAPLGGEQLPGSPAQGYSAYDQLEPIGFIGYSMKVYRIGSSRAGTQPNQRPSDVR